MRKRDIQKKFTKFCYTSKKALYNPCRAVYTYKRNSSLVTGGKNMKTGKKGEKI